MRAILFDKDGTLLDFERTWTPLLKRIALEAARGDADRAGELLEAGGYDTERVQAFHEDCAHRAIPYQLW